MTTVERPTAAWHQPALIAGTAVLLTALACLVGSLRWPVPTRTTSGWQVADVAPSLLTAVVVTGLVCLVAAAVLVRPGSWGSGPAAATWWVLVVASVLAQVWNDLYFAALATDGGIIPVFDWLFAFVPAFVVGLVSRWSGHSVHLRATLGTGVATLPVLGLGWALASQADSLGSAVAGGLYAVAIFGALPLLIAVAITRPRRWWSPPGAGSAPEDSISRAPGPLHPPRPAGTAAAGARSASSPAGHRATPAPRRRTRNTSA